MNDYNGNYPRQYLGGVSPKQFKNEKLLFLGRIINGSLPTIIALSIFLIINCLLYKSI